MDRRQKRYSLSDFDQCSYQYPKQQSSSKQLDDFYDHPQPRNRFYQPESPTLIGHRASFVQLPSFGDCRIPSSFSKDQQYRRDKFQYRQRQYNPPERNRYRMATTTDNDTPKCQRRQSIQKETNFSKSWDKPITGEVRNEKLKEISELRVVNIDKINTKIKNILDKLNQEQNRNNIFAKKIDTYPEKYTRQHKDKQQSRFTSFDSFQFSHNLYGEVQQFASKNQLVDLIPSQNYKFSSKPNIQSNKKEQSNNSYCLSNKYNFTPSKGKVKNEEIGRRYTEIQSPNSQYINKYQIDKYRNICKAEDYKPLKGTFNPHSYNISLPIKNSHQKVDSGNWKLNNSMNFQGLSPDLRYQEKQKSHVWSSDKYKLEKNIKEKQTNRSFICNRNSGSIEKNITKSSLFDRSSKNSRQHSIVLKNGKNLDNEIQRIQQKMQMLQKIKQDLNLKQQPVQQKLRGKTKSSTPFQMNEHLFKEKKQEPKVVLNEFNFAEKKAQLVETSKISLNSIQKENVTKKNQEVALPKPFQMAKNKQTKRLDSLETSENCRFVSQKPSQSNRKSQQFTIPSHIPLPQSSDYPRVSACLKKLISILNSQIELDSQFRNAKKWFQNVPSMYKWNELRQQLKRQIAQQFNQQQIKNIFTLQEDQNNPFHSVRQSEGSIKLLIQVFIKAQEHWHKYLQGRFMKQQLIQEGFTVKNIDLDRKGTITVEDFLRFINFEANTFYRIRDVTLIFKRITSSYEVDFDSLIQTFCKPIDTEEISSLSSRRSNFMML